MSAIVGMLVLSLIVPRGINQIYFALVIYLSCKKAALTVTVLIVAKIIKKHPVIFKNIHRVSV